MAKDPKKPKWPRTPSTRTAAEQGQAQLLYRSGGDPSGVIVRDDGTQIKPGGGMAPGYVAPAGWAANPNYLGAAGGDIFNPNNYVAAMPVYSDPNLAKPFQTPLPQGRYVDPTIPSPLSAARMAEIEEYKKDPKKYVEDHAAELNNEESLIDKGKNMLSRIFDYQDEADLSIAGVNLSGVESVWDTSLKYMTGFYDVISVGLGGLASALPGGTRTLSGEELSNGRSFMEVLNGEMEGDAPSPGQIIVSSGAASAERFRNGEATLGDFLFNTPLMLAGLLAPESPLQRPGESVEDVLTNTAKREEAFGSGAEKWMSGITDFGLMFADPLIGAGVGVKVARAGALGVRSSQKIAAATEAASRLALDEIYTKAGTAYDPNLIDNMIEANKARAAETTDQAIDRLMNGDPAIEPRLPLTGLEDTAPIFWDDVPIPKYDNPLGEVYHRVVQRRRSDGKKVMSAEEISRLPEFYYNPQRAQMADLLYMADNPVEAALAVEAFQGSKKAMRQLGELAPALGDQALRANFERMTALRMSTEPQKIADARAALKAQRDNLQQQADNATDHVAKRREALAKAKEGLDPNAPPPTAVRALEAEVVKLEERARVLERSVEEVDFLDDVVTGKRFPDPLDTRTPFYDEATATRIVDDMHRRQDFVTKALNADIADAARAGRFQFPTTSNMYSRATTGHRMRSAKAAYQFSTEGAGIIPRRVLASVDADGTQKFDWDWALWQGSSFEGTSGLQRAARVWRWFGEETPSGYIGLKGTSTVNSEREMSAALDLDLYRGDPVVVQRPNADGVLESYKVGGQEARRRYMDEFLSALNDPAQDPLEALKRIEGKVAEDFAWAYYANNEGGMNMVRNAAKRGDRLRDATVEEIRARGFFVDPDDGALQYAPYLRSQLANGTYMQNWHAMEKVLKHEAKTRRGQKIGSAIDVGVDYVAQADNIFQAFWRPATLMRFSYTQRNVFEGMLRAMAYNASLAPLTWPVRGTYNGVRNKVMKVVGDRQYAKAQKALDESSFRPVWDEYTSASQEAHKYNTAMEMVLDGDAEPMMYMFSKEPGKKGAYVKMTRDEYEAKAIEANDRLRKADAALVANKDQFDATVKGTKFGTWREKEIAAVAGRQAENEKAIALAWELINEPDAYDNLLRLDDNPFIVDRLADLYAESALLQRNLEDLTYRPVYALQMYRGHAGRQRRIGSGTSIGPDGNEYHDAWNSPLDEINRGLMSADNTVKQSMSARAGLFDNLFQRILVRHNRPIDYASDPDAWYAGMASVIEDASSNELIRVLMDNNWDEAAAFRWLQSPQGARYSDGISKLFASTDSVGGTAVQPQFLSQEAAAAGGKLTKEVTDLEAKLYTFEDVIDPTTGMKTGERADRIRPFFDVQRDATGKPVRVFDPELTRAYIADISHKVQAQMQGIPAFHEMLRRRTAAKASKDAAAKGITPEEIRAVVDNMSVEERAGLRYVQGSEVVQMGTNKFMDTWTGFTNKVFHALGTIPEDAIVRGPFYQTRYKAVRNGLVEGYWLRKGMTPKEVKKRKKAISASGKEQADTISHEAFKIPSDELAKIEVLAHRAALRDTKEWMYTIDRRTNLGKYGEFIFPFISASQNSAVTIGKLLYKEPWLAPLTADLWRAPTRLGIEDEEGNITMPVPDWWVDTLNKIPFLEGVLEKGQEVTIPKDGLNVMLPDSGFGPLPRPAVWVQVGASELMKKGLFPVETPDAFKALFPGEGADSAYQVLKDYIFGEQNTMSDKWMSWDKVFPASAQRIMEMMDESSSEYGYEFQLIYHSEMMKYRGGERDDKPTIEEIHKKTTNSFWMKFFGNLGVPGLAGTSPLVPVLTRPTPKREAITELQDIYKKMQTTDPANASMNMYNMFGEWGLEAALTKVTNSIGGAEPTPETVTDIQKYDSLIRKTTETLTPDNYDLLSIIVNNRNSPESEYDESAYAWQKATTIPGTTSKFREVQSPEQANAERQRIVGWTMYRQTMDKLDAMLAARGLRSYEANGAEDLKNARQVYIANARNNPDLEGWWVEFSDAGGNRNSSAVRVLETAVQDETFRRGMHEAGKDLTLAAMDQYVYYRKGVVNAIHESGVGITDPSNAWLKDSWDTIRQDLKKSDVRFAEIFDLYLSNDDNPQFAGGYYIDPNLDAYVRGEYVGNR